jgi:hypothetical protein
VGGLIQTIEPGDQNYSGTSNPGGLQREKYILVMRDYFSQFLTGDSSTEVGWMLVAKL